MRKNYHVLPKDGKWAVKSEGSKRASEVVETQREAIEIAKIHARRNHSELVIHGRNGRIREKNSYGIDPYPPKG